MIRLLLIVWDRLSIYLPIAVMGLMALGTYWLVQNSPKAVATAQERPQRTDPDYFMKDFSVTTFGEGGRLKSEVFGVAARHFPASDTVEIDKVRIRSFDDQGRLTTATANRALTNSDATIVELFGNALLIRDAQQDKTGALVPRIEFRGEYLHANTDTERVTSNKPVELRRGNDVFVGDTMDYDNVNQTMVMQGRVKGVIVQDKPPKGKP
ncbi:MAG: LPS export ABC transporter periplasmic protein LptC [Rhodoferax sp.]|jgi:lipopolysaccharide export system protein LptC|nr:LPS export ABC transporter periplasmic protein LptC [Rhodoferax sp.]